MNLVPTSRFDELDWKDILEADEDLRLAAALHEEARDVFMVFYQPSPVVNKAPDNDVIMSQRHDMLNEIIERGDSVRNRTMTDPVCSCLATVSFLR